VISVDNEGPRVSVKWQDKTGMHQTIASRVVCCVPLGVLQSNLIKFTPAFPSVVTEHLNHFSNCSWEKIVIEFTQQFDNYAMMVSCKAPGPTIKKLREDYGASF